MNYTKLILGLILISCFTPLVSAKCEVLQQGDPVYLSEYCDVSRVVSWQTQFAYFSNGYYSDTPTKIVDASGFMRNYYIDPKKFVPGMWYKWDNKYEPGGNSVAFEVRSGKRSNETVVNETVNKTVINKTKTQAMEIPKETDILLARGDYGEIRYGLDANVTGGQNQSAYLWLFGTSGVLTKILDLKLKYSPVDLGYVYEFMPEDTNKFELGRYTGYLQFTGVNKRQDVFYDRTKNNLDSPYKNVSPINLDPFIPERIKQEFEKLINQTEYSDDLLIPVTLNVMEPDVIITDYWEESDNIVIEGTTTMGEGTELVIELNPEHYALPAEIEANRHRVNATGSAKELRKFSVSAQIKWDELSVGHHKMRVGINKYKINVSMDKDFEISGIWVMPTPTPSFRKIVIVESGNTHQVDDKGRNINSTGTATNITTLPTPTPTSVPTPKPTNRPKNVTVTPTPTPVPTPIPKPTDDITIPLNPLLPIGAVIVVGLMIMRRRR